MLNALFITDPKDLHADIPGGVQLCSLEFLEVVKVISPNIITFNVDISKRFFHRLRRKFKIDSYDLYDFNSYQHELIEIINKNHISTVFINKAELIKVAKTIKEHNSDIKIVVMSHGNESGDYLHELTHPNKFHNKLTLFRKKIRLGLNLFTESFYRHRYVDLVCAMSLEEEAIEKWLGAKKTFYLPRVISPKFLQRHPTKNRVGFVGTLTHTPNLLALEDICSEISTSDKKINIRIVGNGEIEGKDLAKKYPFVNYLGRLTNEELESEVCSWSYFLNPIFWYSRGASMKLAQAISWGIPVISTIAGARGYSFKKQFLKLTQNNTEDFVNEIIISTSAENLLKEKQNLLEDVLYTREDIASSLSICLFNL